MNSPNKRFLAGSEVGRRLAVFLDPRAHHKDAVALSRHHTRQGERPRRGPALHRAVRRVLTSVARAREAAGAARRGLHEAAEVGALGAQRVG